MPPTICRILLLQINMADNYIERKMEEYRSGKLSASTKRLTPTGQRPGIVTFPIPRLKIFVPAIDAELVSAFANTGCRVSFCGSDRRAGMTIAERTGAKFFPFEPVRALELSDGIDILAKRESPTKVSLEFADGKVRAVTADKNVEQLAVVLCSTAFEGITAAEVKLL